MQVRAAAMHFRYHTSRSLLLVFGRCPDWVAGVLIWSRRGSSAVTSTINLYISIHKTTYKRKPIPASNISQYSPKVKMTVLNTQSKQPRLSLRPRRESDAEALFPTMSHPDSMRYWSRKPFGSPSDLRDYFSSADNESSSWKCYAITELNSDDTAIGFVAHATKRKGVSEIGYLVAREELGKGYGREAVEVLISRLFDEGQRRMIADVDPDNVASVKLLEKLGFKLEGHLRAEWETHIGIRDSLIYGLLAAEWKDR